MRLVCIQIKDPVRYGSEQALKETSLRKYVDVRTINIEFKNSGTTQSLGLHIYVYDRCPGVVCTLMKDANAHGGKMFIGKEFRCYHQDD